MEAVTMCTIVEGGIIIIWCLCSWFPGSMLFHEGFNQLLQHSPPLVFSPCSPSDTLHMTPYFNVSVCQALSRWNVGCVLFCWGGRAAVFPVIEHEALCSALEIIIGPECYTTSKGRKENILNSLPHPFLFACPNFPVISSHTCICLNFGLI